MASLGADAADKRRRQGCHPVVPCVGSDADALGIAPGAAGVNTLAGALWIGRLVTVMIELRCGYCAALFLRIPAYSGTQSARTWARVRSTWARSERSDEV